MCEIDVLAPGEVVEGRMNYLSGKPHTIFQAISFVRYTATLCKVRKQAAHGSMRQAECSSCADLSRVTAASLSPGKFCSLSALLWLVMVLQ